MGTLPGNKPIYKVTWAPDGQGDLAVVADGANSYLTQRKGTTENDWFTVAPTGAVGFTYNVLQYGLVADGTTDNRLALQSLVNLAVAAGGGTLFFPAGNYYFAIGPAGSRDIVSLSGSSSALKNLNLRLLGEGKASMCLWGGDAGGVDAHFFRVKDGCFHLTAESMGFKQRDAIINPDPIEHHHFFAISGDLHGNCEYFNFINCYFGLCKGDAINMQGGVEQGYILNGATGIAGTVAAGNVAFTPLAQPLMPLRIVVSYPAAWDGGDLTISGTDVHDTAISETYPAVVNDRVIGRQYFKTITSPLAKSLTGTTSNKATIGIACEVKHVVIRGCTFNGFDYDGSNPNYGYRSCVGAQRLTSYIDIFDCHMTGAGDQLIDFEPTGNGELGPWRISRNTLLSNNPKSGSGYPALAVTLSGNGNNPAAGSLLNERTVFEHNYVEGRIGALHLDRVSINFNKIYDVYNDHAPEAMVGLTGTIRDVELVGNEIYTRSVTVGRAIAATKDSPYQPEGLRILGNKIFWYGSGSAVLVEGTDLSVNDNQFIFLGTSTGSEKGLLIDGIETLRKHVSVCGNTFQSRGTGTLDAAIAYLPNAIPTTSLLIAGNKGTEVANTGISLPNGTYNTFPIITDNDFSSAATPIGAGTTVLYVVAGNVKAWSVYRSGTGITDPNTQSSLDSAQLGSLYSSNNGASALYVKSTTGASGWKTVTHA